MAREPRVPVADKPLPTPEESGARFDDDAAATVEYIDTYLEYCGRYQVTPSADILVWLRLRTRCLMPYPEKDALNGDRVLLPLYDLLMRFRKQLFGKLKALDCSKLHLTYSGAVLVAHIMQEPECELQSLVLMRCPIGPEGAAALAPGLRACGTLELLNLKNCNIEPEGGYELAKYLEEERLADDSNGVVAIMDLRNNGIGFDACMRLETAAMKYRKTHELKKGAFVMDLDGNKGIDEILNAASHGVGAVLSIIGAHYMYHKIAPHPDWLAHMAVLLYCTSLIVLYLSSTLYHSFHTLGYTRLIFGTLDHCAIYVLIAGSYTPFLGILLPHEVFYQQMLAFLWAAAIFGFAFSAGYQGSFKKPVELSLYLGMGWAAVCCLEDMTREMGEEGVFLMLAGGVAYTVGVPFFVKNSRTMGIPDHTIWHIFVMFGSLLHFVCIYKYVMPDLAPQDPLCVADANSTLSLAEAE